MAIKSDVAAGTRRTAQSAGDTRRGRGAGGPLGRARPGGRRARGRPAAGKKYVTYVCVLNTGYPVHALYLFYRMPRSAEGTRRPPPGQEKRRGSRGHGDATGERGSPAQRQAPLPIAILCHFSQYPVERRPVEQ